MLKLLKEYNFNSIMYFERLEANGKMVTIRYGDESYKAFLNVPKDQLPTKPGSTFLVSLKLKRMGDTDTPSKFVDELSITKVHSLYEYHDNFRLLDEGIDDEAAMRPDPEFLKY